MSILLPMMDNTELSFRARLIVEAEKWPLEESRLVRLLCAPRCSKNFLRSFALSVYGVATYFIESVARLFCITPNGPLRQFLLDNFLEEAGARVTNQRTVECAATAEHLVWLERFAHACGISDAELRASLNGKRPKPDGHYQLIEERKWLEACSYLLVGQERQIPQYFGRLIPAFKARGFSDEDIVFFHNHLEADRVHGARGLELVIEAADTEEKRAIVLKYVALGARDNWLALGGPRRDKLS